MSSTIKVNNIQNLAGDDSGFDLSTNDVVAVKTANTERMRVDANGNVGIGTTSPATDFHVAGASYSAPTNGLDSNINVLINNTQYAGLGLLGANNGSSFIHFGDGDDMDVGQINYVHADNAMTFTTNTSEAMRIDSNGNFMVGTTSLIGTGNNTNNHIELREQGTVVISANSNVGLAISRGSDDGNIVQLQQAGTVEGTISVSGSTVSYNGFTGLHESSGIATNTAIGTVVSTIDELDVYSNKQFNIDTEEDNPKAGQTRPDHPKVKISDTTGDKSVYGVVNDFNEQGKVNVASVGVGSVRVTGACAKGDLLESNGDGTAKVQDDDIVRSKTIGKVTIGNSDTKEKLVSCVLYCG